MHVDVTEREAQYLADQLERRLATLEEELAQLRALCHRFRRIADDASLVL